VGSVILRLETLGFLADIRTRADGNGRDNKEETLLVVSVGRTNEEQTFDLLVARKAIRRSLARSEDAFMFPLILAAYFLACTSDTD
jgi:hypothetical protein